MRAPSQAAATSARLRQTAFTHSGIRFNAYQVVIVNVQAPEAVTGASEAKPWRVTAAQTQADFLAGKKPL